MRTHPVAESLSIKSDNETTISRVDSNEAKRKRAHVDVVRCLKHSDRLFY